MSGLAPDSQYQIQVRAVNSAGPGVWSGTVTGYTQPLPPGPPIQDFAGSAPTYAKVGLTWALLPAAAACPDATLAEHLQQWNAAHPPVSQSALVRAIRRVGWTRKKDALCP